MQPLKPANPYHAAIVGRDLLNGADSRSAFKVYFVDIVGRADPTRTEWAKCGLRKEDFLTALARTDGVEGVGFVTAFAHITKVFRFGPESEIVMNVRAWHTQGLAPLDLDRSDGYAEFACLAEAKLAADEFRFWAQAESVTSYLATWSDYAGGHIAVRDKLVRYWGA